MSRYLLLHGNLGRYEDGKKVRYLVGSVIELTDEQAARIAPHRIRLIENEEPQQLELAASEPEPEPIGRRSRRA